MSKESVAREWLAARNVIAAFLRDFRNAQKAFYVQDDFDTAAAALIARLASHDPPILLDMQVNPEVQERSYCTCQHDVDQRAISKILDSTMKCLRCGLPIV